MDRNPMGDTKRIVNGPRDWPMTQHGEWVAIRATYADCYPWWDRRRYKWDGRLSEYWYYWRCRLWNRWNTLTIRTLGPTWTEWDEKMLHAAMAVFMDYFENRGESHGWTPEALRAVIADPNSDEHSKGWCQNYLPVALEMDAIYKWWTEDRFSERAEQDAALMKWHDVYTAAGGTRSQSTDNPRLSELVFASSDEADRLHAIHHEIETRNDNKEQEMLHRLIDIRRHLWT
jgi:hypothetical protein